MALPTGTDAFEHFYANGLIQKLESNGFEVAKVERPWSPSE